jgi:hypothetical protein
MWQGYNTVLLFFLYQKHTLFYIIKENNLMIYYQKKAMSINI